MEKPTPVRWAADGNAIVILDQTRLPGQRVESELGTLDEIVEAIQSLRVRGAPLIGIVAAMGLAALARRAERSGVPREELGGFVEDWCSRIAATRPTAVNLTWALGRMRDALAREKGDAPALAARLAEEAQAIWDEDREMCHRIGQHGCALLTDGARVLTHCNAGALATGGIGTALAPLYLAHEAGVDVRVLASETRPLLQGSRLTAWELMQAGIDVTVLTEGGVGGLFTEDPPDVVFVGADRIAANGDVANKVGTYALAVLARRHGVPFYALAPTSTVDLTTLTGADIPIEHRSADEVREGFGRPTAPADVRVWSPAFDVTPSGLITGIVTEQGVCRAPFEPALREAVAAAAEARASR